MANIDDTRVANLDGCYLDSSNNGGSDPAITTSTDIIPPPIGEILSDISSRLKAPSFPEAMIKEELTTDPGELMENNWSNCVGFTI